MIDGVGDRRLELYVLFDPCFVNGKKILRTIQSNYPGYFSQGEKKNVSCHEGWKRRALRNSGQEK